jgi:DNA-binding NtrC family response regulator
MTKNKVLIVDDDSMTLQTLSMALEDSYETLTAENGLNALAILGREDIDVVLSDLDMPGLNGIELLRRIQELETPVPMIVITGQGTIETAVEAMKLGACDYVTKPVNLDRLCLLIEKTLENKQLKEENRRLKQQLRENGPELNIIGSSEALAKCRELALQVAPTNATVLIEGESGTGKELITNIIHYNSTVAHGPFIKVNCSAFSEGVLESELFGHEKGAFTGATATKKGRFELADKGTLFLDEAGEIPPSIQVKLLRFLQEKTFERVGGTRTIKVDVRIISATNKDLGQLVAEGKFRDDLFYRLQVVKITIPPLRERKEDLDELIPAFIARFARLHGKPVIRIEDDALDLIRAYNWPGNIRELMNCIESGVVMAQSDIITVDDIPEYLTFKTPGREGNSGHGLLQELERKAIIDTLHSTRGEKVKAAKILGIGLRTLYRKLEKYELEV